MEVSSVPTNNSLTKITDGETSQEVVPYSSDKGPTRSARVIPLKRKSLEKDALLAVKLDPAVLEAQVTLTKDEVKTPNSRSSLVAIESEGKGRRSYPSYEEVVSMQEAALLGLTPQQLMLLMAFVDTLRRQRERTQREMECAFCKKNGSPVSWYTSHALRDGRGRARCPVLRALRCPICGATGNRAHTAKYCPQNIFSGVFCKGDPLHGDGLKQGF